MRRLSQGEKPAFFQIIQKGRSMTTTKTRIKIGKIAIIAANICMVCGSMDHLGQ
jgi:hypothetical protein